jgi:LEA14-like dessication related protein
MKMLAIKIVPLLFAFLLLNGCAAINPLSGLGITIVDFKPAADSAGGSQATLNLRIVNENEVGVAVANSKHKLYLNGTYVGTAISHEPFALGRLNTTMHLVTFHLENLPFVQKLAADSNGAMVNYRLESEIFVEVNEDRSNVKTSFSGQLSLSAFAAPTAVK